MKKFAKFFSGKGYYIALVLCAVAIGISGYLYYRNADNKLEDTPVSVEEPDATEDLVAVVGTQPNSSEPSGNANIQTTLPVTTKPMQTCMPLEGQVVAAYAMDALGYNPTTRDWRTHNGMDIAAETGTAVCAAADGTVYTVYEDETMGMTVVIRHDGGYVTCYSSLAAEVEVKAGDVVQMGQKIGCVGNTALLENAIGEHVHVSVTCNDEPVDPAEFFAGK